MDILIALVERPGQVVSQRELFARIWPNQAVDASILRVHVTTLRKALAGREGSAARYIANVPGRGYSFVAPLSPVPVVGTEAAADPNPPSTNLPLPLTEIIGRGRELTELADWLGRSRLVTLVGPGGVGKTRLAVELGWRVLGEFPAGVWLIDLAPLTDREAVASALAAVLGIAVTKAGTAVNAIVAALGKTRPLLLFDNCEHLAEAAAALIKTLLERSPGVSILATSQTDLHLAAERVYGLDPLGVPPAGIIEIRGYAAAELFSRRARAADRMFELHDGNSAGIGEICRQLDGLPLALEMAAGRLRMLGVEGLRRGLGDRLKMLKGAPDDDPRHASLHGTLDWSHSLLAPFDRKVFRRLAVFRGSFSLTAEMAVAGAGGAEDPLVVDALGRLIDRSLVTLTQREPTRYRLLETLRLYATDKLQEAGETDAVAELHARHFLLIFEGAEESWETTPSERWLELHQPEVDNVRVALDWAFAAPERRALAIALAGAAARLWNQVNNLVEGRRYLDRAVELLDESTPPAVAARLLRHAGGFWLNTDRPRATALLERAAMLYEHSGDRLNHAAVQSLTGYLYTLLGRRTEAAATLDAAYQVLVTSPYQKAVATLMVSRGTLSLEDNDTAAARHWFTEALARARLQSNVKQQALCLSNLAQLEYALGNVEEAVALEHAALPWMRRSGTRNMLAWSLTLLATYLIVQHKPAEARPIAEEALSLAADIGGFVVWECLEKWAMIGALAGRHSEAARLIGFVDARRAEAHNTLHDVERQFRERLDRLLQASLPQAEIEAATADGAQWTEGRAVEFALAMLVQERPCRDGLG